jgi:raffinose/stachyose/melibiose transport system substrate-binding protein
MIKQKPFLLVLLIVMVIATACGGAEPAVDTAALDAAQAAAEEAEAKLEEAQAALEAAEADAAASEEEIAAAEAAADEAAAAAEAAQAEAEAAQAEAEAAAAALAEEKEKVTITFWTLSSRTEGVNAILDDFHAANPDVTVEVVIHETTNHRDGLRIAASSDSLPSVWFNWGGSLGGFYAENGLTYDLTDYAAANNWDEKFDGAALDLSTLHGQLSGYPTSLSMVGVFYRQDIFQELGIEEPTTFEEFEAACATLLENGYTPIAAAGGNHGWHVMRVVEQLIEYYAGADLHDEMATFGTSVNNEAMVQALTKFKEWADKGYIIEGFVSGNANEMWQKLPSGDAVMAFEGQWFERNVLQNELDHSLFGFFPFPSGGTNRMSAFVEMYQFSADLTDAELDAAVRFMDFYYGKDAIDTHPANYKYPVPITGIDIPDANVLTKEMVEAIAEAGSFTITDQAFPTEVASVLFNAQDEIALGSMTPEEGAAAIQEAIETYLAGE